MSLFKDKEKFSKAVMEKNKDLIEPNRNPGRFGANAS